ncbi:hypothetical protein KUTeg_003310 [Tegillarca granosa]|uniref:DUF4371 domain-containing protein n=1 Tax=Tegillarca granosa TaxID=220873 RepID=A0ABQ9FLS1_TEGGR|nr:hypothetical protein KUTeg_003310 [Tegillarca granosa]
MYRNKNTIDRFLVGRSAQTATPKLSQPQIQVSEFKPESNNAEENLCKARAGAGPTYPDIACIKTKSFIDDSTKQSILEGTWDNVHKFTFPYRYLQFYQHFRYFNTAWVPEQRKGVFTIIWDTLVPTTKDPEMSGIKRKLSKNVLVDNQWMRYSWHEDAVYCGPCFLFGRKDAKEKLFINPVNDWSNLSCFVKRHLKSESPHYIYHGMAEDFLRVRNGVDESIDVKISESRKNDVIANKHVLLKIIEVLLLCGRQNIPIRGHLPERSNFVEILNFKASDDDILTEHLNSSKREKYTSPDIQNEIINIMGDQIRQTIVDKCNSSRCFALIADETTDKSVKEQMESRTKLRTLCETRWTSRADSLYTFKTAFPVVIHALEQLEDDGDQKAKQYLSAIMKFDFIISLVMLNTS